MHVADLADASFSRIVTVDYDGSCTDSNRCLASIIVFRILQCGPRNHLINALFLASLRFNACIP